MKMKEVLAWLNVSLQFWVCSPLTSKTNHYLSKKGCFNQNTVIYCDPEVPSDEQILRQSNTYKFHMTGGNRLSSWMPQMDGQQGVTGDGSLNYFQGLTYEI